MCHSAFERAVSGALRIGVDPLVVTGGLREQIDLLLAELHPFGGAQRTSDEIEQVGWFLETNCHQFPCAAMEQLAPLA